MDEPAGYRWLTEGETEEMTGDVTKLARSYASRILDGAVPPGSARYADMDDTQRKTGILGVLQVLRALHEAVGTATTDLVVGALGYGATFEEIGGALGVTRQAAEKRWGYATQGWRPVIVISRRDRVRRDDANRPYGEVGGAGQYESDRGEWPVGAEVRAAARHAIVAVDGTVRRVYAIELAGWHQVRPGKWQFTAAGGRELSAAEIGAAYAAGDLPFRAGDDCPTKVGGAYRPHWFWPGERNRWDWPRCPRRRH